MTGQFSSDLTLILLHDLTQCDLSEERNYSVIEEMTVLTHRQFYRTTFVDNEPFFKIYASWKFKFFSSHWSFKQISSSS
jgi:hypothetical protein